MKPRKKHTRIMLANAAAECRSAGIAVSLESGGKHLKLVFTGHGQRRTLPLPHTPAGTQVDAVINNGRKQARRLAEDMGKRGT